MAFKRAERKRAKLRLGVCGPSGSGKTMTSLLIAKGLGGKIALIDSERGSGDLYADVCEYDTSEILPPYTPKRYVEKIAEAESLGYDVIIIDSGSHAWAGEGGALEMKDNIAKATKNDWTAWRDVSKDHSRLVDKILGSPAHIIFTMRSKVQYEVQKNSKGKMVPVKVGTAPIQREGMDYEMTLVMDLSVDGHVAIASKDRTGLFDGTAFVPSESTGQMLVEWLNTGSELELKLEEKLQQKKETETASKKPANVQSTIDEMIVQLGEEKTFDGLKGMFATCWYELKEIGATSEQKAIVKEKYDELKAEIEGGKK